MSVTIEMERVIYSFEEGKHEDKLMLVKEQKGDKIAWRPLAKGWEYQLWYSIGERGGLAEAEELILLENNNQKKVSIEEYIELYRKTLSRMLPIEDVFKRFEINVLASRMKAIDNEDKRDKYVVERMEEDYKLEKIGEDGDKIYYQKEIYNIEDIQDIPLWNKSRNYQLEMVFAEKNKVA